MAAETRVSHSRRGASADRVRVRADPRLCSRTQTRRSAAMVVGKVREFHLKDRDCPINYEPSGQDFLSPCIAEADLMRRVLPPNEFAAWLTAFLPRLPATDSADWLPIGVVTDKTDGKLAHLDGLNLSRAWMLEGIAAGLPPGDPRRARADGGGAGACRQRARRGDRRALRRRALARQLRHLPHYTPRDRQITTCGYATLFGSHARSVRSSPPTGSGNPAGAVPVERRPDMPHPSTRPRRLGYPQGLHRSGRHCSRGGDHRGVRRGGGRPGR